MTVSFVMKVSLWTGKLELPAVLDVLQENTSMIQQHARHVLLEKRNLLPDNQNALIAFRVNCEPLSESLSIETISVFHL
jgi:hypothetical protein